MVNKPHSYSNLSLDPDWLIIAESIAFFSLYDWSCVVGSIKLL